MKTSHPTLNSIVSPHAARLLALGCVMVFGTARAAEYPCLIEPHVVADLSTAVEGVLAAVNVKKGDIVGKGDVVAVLESGVEEATVEHAQARANMTSPIKAREVTLERNEEKYKRAVKLSSQKFASADELNELKSAVDLARLDLETERENQLLAKIELKREAALLDRRQIRSPISGVVVERHLNPGEFAQAQPIVRIAQLDPLNVEAVLPGALYGSVREGMDADVSIPAPLGLTLHAKVTIVEKVIEAASGTFGVRIELPNPDYSIPAGLECTVSFVGAGTPAEK